MKYKTAALAALAFAMPALGHHSDAGLDMNSVVTIEGTVTEFSWRNPHVYINVEAEDEHGETSEWSLQLGSTITVSRMGWDRDSLAPGDRVTVRAHAAIDGRPYGLLDFIEKEGGVVLPTRFDSGSGEPIIPQGEATASTTNRNFARRMGAPGPVYLVSPAVAAATAVSGRLTDPRSL